MMKKKKKNPSKYLKMYHFWNENHIVIVPYNIVWSFLICHDSKKNINSIYFLT